MQFGKANFYFELQKSEVYTICLYKMHHTTPERKVLARNLQIGSLQLKLLKAILPLFTAH